MFPTLARICAAVCAALAAILLLVPNVYAVLHGVDPGPSGAFLGRRLAPLFAGLALMLWLSRDAPRSPQRQAMCLGLALAWGGIACTGLLAFSRGEASLTVLLAGVVEAAFCGAFLLTARRD